MAFTIKRGIGCSLTILKWFFLLVFACLALLIAVTYFRYDRPFDKEGWDKADLSHNSIGRCGYAGDLIGDKLILGKTTEAEVIALLGKEYEGKTLECEQALSYNLGWCSMMDGHTLDVCFDSNDVVIKARDIQH